MNKQQSGLSGTTTRVPDVVRLGTPTGGLIGFEVVMSALDFFISVNGALDLIACMSYSINEEDCFVFHQKQGEVVSWPIPATFRELIDAAPTILFVQFERGEPVDAKELSCTTKESIDDHHC